MKNERANRLSHDEAPTPSVPCESKWNRQLRPYPFSIHDGRKERPPADDLDRRLREVRRARVIQTLAPYFGRNADRIDTLDVPFFRYNEFDSNARFDAVLIAVWGIIALVERCALGTRWKSL